MALKDDFIQSSINNIPVFIENIERGGGRRVQNFEFSNSEENATLDHGKKSRSFGVTCFVLGEDWRSQRDLVQDELEKIGIIEFIHPSRGLLRVRCTDYKINDDMTDNGRCAVFSITFIEAGRDVILQPSEDILFQLSNKVAEIVDLSKNDFARKFDVNGQPQAFVDPILGSIQNIGNAVDNSTRFIVNQGVGVSEIRRKTSGISTEINDLVKAPSRLADALTEAISLAIGTSKNRGSADLILASAQRNNDPLQANTENRRREKSNQNELSTLVRRVAVTAKTETIINDLNFDNISDAYAVRDQLIDDIELEKEFIDDPDLFASFADLTRFAVELIPGEKNALPKIETIEPKKTLPSLVAVFNKFGDIEAHDDFVARNNPANPCFMKGGQKYEVIKK